MRYIYLLYRFDLWNREADGRDWQERNCQEAKGSQKAIHARTLNLPAARATGGRGHKQ